jgi:hypothetical protein
VLTTQQLALALYAIGAPAHLWRWKDASYDGLSPAWVREAWGYWVASLPERLTHVVQIGGGKTEKRPLWRPEIFDCDNHALSFTAYAIECCAVDALATGRTRTGTALGSIDYTARNSRRVGRHAALWFADHDGAIHFFEPADGELITLTDGERASITEGFAA